VTSAHRATKQLKLRPYRFQAVHQLQQRDTAARIQYYKMLIMIFWVVKPRGLIGGYQHFRRTYRLHFQGDVSHGSAYASHQNSYSLYPKNGGHRLLRHISIPLHLMLMLYTSIFKCVIDGKQSVD
jgi:hypothetical protein